MGLWGMGNLTGKDLGSILGGGAVDALQVVTGGVAQVSCAAVFACRSVLLYPAPLFFLRLDIGRSHAQEEAAPGAEALRRAAD